MPATEKELDLHKLVKIATKGYRNYHQLYEDIQQEAWVAALHYIEHRKKVKKKVTPMGVIFAIKKRIYIFCNLKQLPVTVPTGAETVAAHKRGELFSQMTSCELLEESITDDCTSFINEFKNDEQVVRDIVEVYLEGQLKEVIVKRYFEEKTLRQTGIELDLSPSVVYTREQQALNVLLKHI